MIKITKTLIVFVLLSINPVLAAEKIINLNHRAASDIRVAIMPLMQEDEKLIIYQNNLIISASEERLKKISNIISTLDMPVQNVMIQFAMGHHHPGHRRFIEERRTYNTSHSKRRNINTLRVLNNEEAQIDSEHVFALLNYRSGHSANGSRSGNITENTTASSSKQTTEQDLQSDTPTTTETESANLEQNLTGSSNGSFEDKGYAMAQHFASIENGIWVRPIIMQDGVTLELFGKYGQTKKNPTSRHDEHFTQHKMITKVHVPINEWVYLGGNRTTKDLMNDGYHYQTQAKDDEKFHVWLRVSVD